MPVIKGTAYVPDFGTSKELSIRLLAEKGHTMANKLAVGDGVYVPCSRVPELASIGVALYRSEVFEVRGKKAKVRLRDGSVSDWIGKSLLHRDVGIAVINIGDFDTEHVLLDPLAKSVTQFCRLLVPDDQIRSVRIRSLEELKCFWSREQSVYTHIVWIGHGSETGVKFAVDGWVTAEKLVAELKVRGAPKKTYISLCCKTGYKSFGSVASKATICSNFIGPFHSVDGAVASQFCQTFLTSHLLEGRTTGVAFRHARKSVPGSSSFRLWKSGNLKAGPK